MKTNKSFTKRLRTTKKGKVLARKPGGNHFLAKESRRAQLSRRSERPFGMTSRARRRFLPGR